MLLLAVCVVCAHFALGRWQSGFAEISAPFSVSVATILVARRIFCASPVRAAFIAVMTAIVSSMITIVGVTSFRLLSSPTDTQWKFGGGFATIVLAALVGAWLGFIVGTLTALIYGVKRAFHLILVDRIDRYYVEKESNTPPTCDGRSTESPPSRLQS